MGRAPAVSEAPTEDPRPDDLERAPSVVIVNTGDGKGKSSAAFGVMIRAVARGWPVAVVQFIKSGKWHVGEEDIGRRLGVEWFNVGDGFTTSAVGVLDYSFGKSKLNVTQPLTRVDNGLAHEVTSAPAAGELVVATFNVENLSPNDPQSKFDALANQIVNHLRSPDVITLEEIQDNNGATDNRVVDANVTLCS